MSNYYDMGLRQMLDEGKCTQEYFDAMYGREDTWVPACGGMEIVDNRGVLYVFNPRSGKHGFCGIDDIVYNTYEEAAQ